MITSWRKPTYSTSETTNQCVEVGTGPDSVGVRDTKACERGHLTVSRTAWRTFVRHLDR